MSLENHEHRGTKLSERKGAIKMNNKAKALSRAKEFEKSINKQEKQMLRERASRVKKGGFSSEKDYFTNVNPFTGKRRGS